MELARLFETVVVVHIAVVKYFCRMATSDSTLLNCDSGGDCHACAKPDVVLNLHTFVDVGIVIWYCPPSS